ncbi:CBS domain-containing protein [Mucilaginibacter calamicampi]|uniref:CBS domain-containing protein n=1 Tax=Mucilaginibacter calamicampi TaxID=1302352 RepID=A0ABW2Z0I1_9SPHI
MRKVADILRRKGQNVFSIDAGTSVLEALKLMAGKNIGSVVITENGVYAGILTERDYARKVILMGRSSEATIVRDIMSTGIPQVAQADSIDQCMHLMSEGNVRYLPVFDGDKQIGIISINDVVAETILLHEQTIEHLQSYIHS